MSNRFGINSATTEGDNNPPTADAPGTETAEKPFTGLNFNSVVSSSFNTALTDADQMLKAQAAAPKPDNSSLLSMGGNFLGGTATGVADQFTSIFKKDKATLAREADQGGISALTSGHSITSSFTRTAGEVAHALPALNPLSQDGRKNLGILKDKYVEGWTTGTADDRARFAGTNFSFILTLGVGGGTAVKGGKAIATDLRGGTIATRALGLTDNVAGATDELAAVGRNVARVTETSGVNTAHAFYPAVKAPTLIEKVTAPVARLTDNIAPKASSLPLRTSEAIVNQERRLISSLSDFYPGARPANLTSTAITDASKGATAVATKEFTESLSRIIPNSAAETTALQEVRLAAQKLAAGGPEAQNAFIQAIEKSGAGAENLMAHGNSLVRNVERTAAIERFGVTVDNAVKGIGTKLETLNSGVAKGSAEAKALQNIQTLADDVARGGSKTDELIQAVNALKRDMPALKPQVVDELLVDVSKLESAATGRRLLTSLERPLSEVKDAATAFQTALEKTRLESGLQNGDKLLTHFDDLKGAAEKFVHGGMSREQFAAKLDDLKNSGAIIKPEALEALKELTEGAAKLTEKVNVSNLFTHMDEMVRPVKTVTSELDNALAALPRTPEVTKVQQAIADFVAGRSGNTEELTAAIRNLAANEKSLAAQAGKTFASADEAALAVKEALAKTTKLSDDLVKVVENARPAMTLEKSIAESTPLLEEAARRWANNPLQLNAINEVKAAFNGAMKGTVTADDLAQVVSRNSAALERAVPGSTKALTVNGTRIADASVDASRALAIKNGVTEIARTSDDVVNAVKALRRELAGDAAKAKPLQSLEEAVTAFKAAKNPSAQLTDDLQNAIQAARKADVPFSPAMENFARSVERTSTLQALEASVVKSRQAAHGITATTDLMEAAVRQAPEFKAIDNLRNALRSGDSAQIAKAAEESKAILAKVNGLPNGFANVVDDVVKAGATPTNKQLSRLTSALDNVELAVKRNSDEFKALEEIRAAARKASADGIGEDLARVIQQNERHIASMQQKAAAIEAKLAGAESRTVNLAEKLQADAKLLGDEAANARRLTNVENSSRSMTNVLDNLDEVARRGAFRSPEKGSALAREVRELSEQVSDVATKTRLKQTADLLDSKAGTFNYATERLNVIKSLSDDVARGTVKESEYMSFVKKSSTQLDEIGEGTAKLIESKAAAVADSRKLVVAREAADAIRTAPSLADEAGRLGFKANSEVHTLAADFSKALDNFANKGGTIDDVSAAAKKLNEFKPIALNADEARNLAALQTSAKNLEKATNEVSEAISAQLKAYVDAANSRNVSSYSTALNHIANTYDIAPPLVRNELLKVRENILDHLAARLVQEQGYYGPKTLAQRAFGGVDGGESLISRVRSGSFNVNPIAGLETNKGQLLDAAERFNNRMLLANQEKFSVTGLIQDRAKLLANPTLAQEVRQRALTKALLEVTAGLGIVGMSGWALKGKAQDVLYTEVNAPYKIAELMEKEISAKTDAEREQYRAQLATMVAEHIKGKDQSQIDELREQLKTIIAERISENVEAQAVWTRRQEDLSVGEMLNKKEHANQVQYGNPQGPNRGPGAASTAQESSQQIFMASPAKVRSTSVSNVDQDGNKRKPATTNFDINKIRDMSNNIAYSQSGLRANPMGTSGQSLANAYTPGSTKGWQNVVSWNSGRKFAAGEPSGKHVYGNFSNLENNPENDQAGVGGGGAVAQNGPANNDPAVASMQLAAAQAQKQQQANQDENATSAAV